MLANEIAHEFVVTNGSRPSGAANYYKRDEAVARIKGSQNAAILAIKVHGILAAQPGNGEHWANTLERMLTQTPSLEQLKPEIVQVLELTHDVMERFLDVAAVAELRPRVRSLYCAVRAS